MKHSNRGLGIILLIIGVIMLLNNIQIITFNIELLWPLFMIIPGIMFHLGFFNGRHKNNPSVLMAGAVLSIYGLYFLFNIITHWQFSHNTWPIIPLGIGVGFFEMYWFAGKKSQHGISGLFIIALSLFAFVIDTFNLSFAYILPITLILVGVVIVSQSFTKHHHS
jgi:hypothetical protein